MPNLNPIDGQLKNSAQDELQGRMKTITKQIASRTERRDGLRLLADEEEAAITELLRLHDEYQRIVGRSFDKERTVTVNLRADAVSN